MVSACRETKVRYSITVRQHARLRNLIEAIPEDAWTPIPYWMDGAAAVAETTDTPFRTEPDAAPVRLIVRRVQPTPGSQLALFANYSYHGCITDREGDTLELEADHRRHAEIENAIRALKYGVGLNHLPSGRFSANAAWLAVQSLPRTRYGVIAHNLARWTARIGLGAQIVTTKTLRRWLFSLAGRLTHSARRLTLHLPSAGPGKPSSVAPSLDCEPYHSQPDGAPSAADSPSGPLNVPANSRQVSPRGAPLACTLPNSARHGHRGPPSSGLCGHLTPSSSPSIGIWPGPFAFPYPSAPVSTPAPIPSVDSGLSDHPKSQVVASSAASALELIANEWEAGRGSPYHAVRILRLALRVKDTLNKDMLVRAQQAVFNLVTGQLPNKDSFEALVELARLETDLFEHPQRRLKSWADEFESFLEGERDSLVDGEDDPDWLESEMSDIRMIADAMGVYIDDLEYLVEERINKLRSAWDLDEVDDLPDLDSDAVTESEEVRCFSRC